MYSLKALKMIKVPTGASKIPEQLCFKKAYEISYLHKQS